MVHRRIADSIRQNAQDSIFRRGHPCEPVHVKPDPAASRSQSASPRLLESAPTRTTVLTDRCIHTLPVCVPAPPCVFLPVLSVFILPVLYSTVPVKRHRGGRDTHGTRGHTEAHGPHRRTSQPSKPTNNTQPACQRDDRSRGRLKSRRPGVRYRYRYSTGAFVRPRVPCVSCVSRLHPVSFYRYRFRYSTRAVSSLTKL